MLACRPAAGDDDADARGGQVHAFVQDLRGDERVVDAGAEVLEDAGALGDLRLVGDDRQQEPARQGVRSAVALGEEQRAVAPVPVQQLLDVGELGRRRERDLLVALVGGHGAPPLRALRRAHDELRPPVGARHPDALAHDERPVHRARLVVGAALVVGQLHENALDVVVGEIVAGEVAHPLAVDDGSDQRFEVGVAAVEALRGCGQAHPVRREAALGRQRVGGAGQVMALVEHGETEAGPEVLHVEEGGVVGRDGDGLDAMVAAAEDADLHPEPLAQQPVPLPDQVEGRRHDDGVAAHRVHGQQRHLGLAGPRRQDDDPAPLRGPPRLDRLGLEGSRLAAHPQPPVENAVAPGLVLVRDPAAHKRPHHRRIGGGRGAEPPGPRVPPAGVGQPRLGGPVEPADVQRAGGEAKADSHLEWRGVAPPPIIIRGAAARRGRARRR